MAAHPDVRKFQQDNAMPHTARVCVAYLQNAAIQVMDWPAKSPDLSPIENLWATLQHRIKGLPNPPATVHDLGVALQQEWQAIPQHKIWALFNSMR